MAAFRIARDTNALPVWSELLRFLCAVAADPHAARALDNPKLTAADKAALLLSIGGERLDATGRSFVKVLVDADRVAVLPQIRALFEALKNDADGVAKARIDSAFPLSDAQMAEQLVFMAHQGNAASVRAVKGSCVGHAAARLAPPPPDP